MWVSACDMCCYIYLHVCFVVTSIQEMCFLCYFLWDSEDLLEAVRYILYITHLSGIVHLKSTFACWLAAAIVLFFDCLSDMHINFKWALFCQSPRELLWRFWNPLRHQCMHQIYWHLDCFWQAIQTPFRSYLSDMLALVSACSSLSFCFFLNSINNLTICQLYCICHVSFFSHTCLLLSSTNIS